MSKHDPRIRFLHMREFAQKAIDLARDYTIIDLYNDEKLQLALTRLVELIGEAAYKLPSEIRELYPEIPWRHVINMRHRLIHGYDFVDYEILWETIKNNLPELLERLEQIIEAFPTKNRDYSQDETQ